MLTRTLFGQAVRRSASIGQMEDAFKRLAGAYLSKMVKDKLSEALDVRRGHRRKIKK